MHITEVEKIVANPSTETERRLADALLFQMRRELHYFTQEQINRAYSGCGCSSWGDAGWGLL